MTLAERTFPPGSRLPLAVTLFWLLVGASAGIAQMASLTLAGGQGVRALGPPLLASAIWVPLTLGAISLARRAPLLPPLRAGSIGVHLLGAASISFVLNAAYRLGEVALGTAELTSVPAFALRAGLLWWHINAGTYLVIVIATSWAARAPERRPEFGAPVTGGEERIRAEAGGRVHLLPVDSIDWIEGAGDYARLHVDDRDYLCSRRLKELERSLAPARFVRIHRSAIVNVARIARLEHLARGDYRIELTSGATLRASRRRRAELQRAVAELELPPD